MSYYDDDTTELHTYGHDETFGFRFKKDSKRKTDSVASTHKLFENRIKEAARLYENEDVNYVKGVHKLKARLFKKALSRKPVTFFHRPTKFTSPHFMEKVKEKKLDLDTSDSGSLLDSDTRIDQGDKKERRRIDKSGLLWGTKREGEIKDGPGPATFNIKRYPPPVKENAKPFNITTVRKVTKTSTPVAVYNLSKKRGAPSHKHSFGGRKELNIPKIICVSPVIDRCVKCKNEITHRYFYLFHKTFLCHLCRNKIMRGTNLNEKMKILMFEEARYCVRYHDHENVKFYDKLVSNKDLYKILQKEVYLRQYLNPPTGIERVPSKKKWQTSTERGEIYESLVPHGNWKTKEGLCEYLLGGDDIFGLSLSPTLGAQLLIESATGEKVPCTPDVGVCSDPFVFPAITSSTSLINY